ncbi:antibiotic biosynthesis monooxygenase family protein [Arthrobacter sp. VKM Ac-2550]|uniref:antibiotic biosynthesis monooxygenase family protein n=1 Tax=Crystallibacter permensis TaxID=1938888 RepID=UPI00222698EF|nr:antibiotic biosynthesis monooxygenase [Arthrobacter sp. VKM Ac-2550]MCW2135180.1 Heme-degrading monooxygenase HmoA [Arthrobacter sp. VKM Ac-2550]
MITEHALLQVRPGQDTAFEAAFREASAIISAMRGFGKLSLSRCIEHDRKYLLLVEWDRLEDHTEGFRGSADYQQWKKLLHHFYEPFPTVEHYSQIVTAT